MKKGRFLLVLMLALVLCAVGGGMLYGCSDNKCTVTFYSGAEDKPENIIKTVKVKSGDKVDSFVPVKEGFTFVGWYATPLMNRAFKFDEPITKDVKVFANWKSAVFVADVREWVISGDSPVGGDAGLGAWKKPSGATDLAKVKLTRAESTTENKFTKTMDMFPGDSFQIINTDKDNTTWLDKRGYGYIESPGDFIKKEDTGFGETSALGANITIKTSGNYTITLSTEMSNSTLDRISFVRNGEPLADKRLTIKPSLAGTITGGKEIKNEADFGKLGLVKEGATDVYSTTVDLNKNDSFVVLPSVGSWSNQMKPETLDADTAKAAYINIIKKDPNNTWIKESGTYKISATIILSDDSYSVIKKELKITQIDKVMDSADNTNTTTVNFVFEDETQNYAAYVRNGAKIPVPFKDDNPVKEGEVFCGWYSDLANNVPVDEKLAFSETPITVQPKFLSSTATDTRVAYATGYGKGWGPDVTNKMTFAGPHTYTITMVITAEKPSVEFVCEFFEAIVIKDELTNVKTGIVAKGPNVITEKYKADNNISISGVGSYLVTLDSYAMTITIVKQ